MLIRTPMQTGYGGIVHVEVSLPLVEMLVDGSKYRLPGDAGPRLDGTEAYRARAPRGPTLRSLVKLALRCQSAEEMGQKLKRRFDRSLRRQGVDPNGGRASGRPKPSSSGCWQMTGDGLRGAAFHEAGHAVIALALGLRVARVEIFDEDNSGETDIAPQDHLPPQPFSVSMMSR